MAKYSWDDPAPRDVRRTDPVHPPKPPSRKNKKLWCRGKVGVEHTPEIVIPENFWGKGNPRFVCGPSSWRVSGWSCFHQFVCSGCGKHLSRQVTRDECEAEMAARRNAEKNAYVESLIKRDLS